MVTPPYELDHVELELRPQKELSVYVGIVDVVLWCCRLQSLTLTSSYPFSNLEEWRHVVKVLVICTFFKKNINYFTCIVLEHI